MKNSKRFSMVALIIAVCALLVMFAACQNGFDPENNELLTGELNFKLSDKTIVDGIDLNYSAIEENEAENTYNAADEVSVIISLGEGSLVESYLDMNPGVSVAEFISSAEGKGFTAAMISKQEAVLAKMDELGIEYEFKYSLMTLMDGFSVTMKYGEYKKMSALDGVEYCIAETFSVPELPENSIEATYIDSMGQLLNDTSYTGKGTLIAIIDSGVDVWHEAFATEPEGQLVSYEYVESVMSSMYASYNFGGYTAADVYYSGKIPFGFDYADGDNDPVPDIFSYYMGLGLEHGTHVAGIAAGYSDTIKSAAYNAQIAAMKVGSDETGAVSLDNVVVALGDAIILGADAVNISIGSGCGPERETNASYNYLNTAYDLAERVGLIVNASAGNDYSVGYAANGNLPENPDTGVIGKPGSYLSVFTSGSVNSGISQYIHFEGAKYRITNSANENSQKNNFYDILNGEESGEFEYVVVPGLGAPEDYEGIDVAGKIALVMRGELSFADKVNNAAAAGAIGVLIHNTDDTLISAVINDGSIPTAAVTKTVGDMLAAAENKVITVNGSDIEITISEFSSWGPTKSLDIGIDLLAPGGNIYSSVPSYYVLVNGLDVDYEYMSGTSMSSPNQGSATLVMKEYVKSVFPNLTSREMKTLIYQLLMSTAQIIEDENGNPESPRHQGAGLTDINAAVNTKAYLTVTGSDRVKLNLGSDIDKSGIYTLNFNLVNFGDTALSYDVGALVFSETVGMTLSPMNVERLGVLEQAYMFNDAGITVSVRNGALAGNTVTVEAGTTAAIKVVIELTEANKKYLDETFVNGMYVEGFATLKALDEGSYDLSIPFISFYGDWDHLPMFEPTLIDEAISGNYDRQLYPNSLQVTVAIPGSTSLSAKYQIGMYSPLYALPAGYLEAPEATYDKAAIGINTEISTVLLTTYRNVEVGEFNLVDPLSGTYYANDIIYALTKTYLYNGYSLMLSQLNISGLTVDANSFANNQQLYYEIVAYWDYEKGIYETLTYPVYVDLEAPTLEKAEIVEENGRYLLKMDVYDNHYLMNFALYTEGEGGLVSLMEAYEPVYTFNKGLTNTVTYDITALKDKIVDGKLSVEFVDYALNSVIYEIETPYAGGTEASGSSIHDSLDLININGNTYVQKADGTKVLLSDYMTVTIGSSETVRPNADEDAPEFVIEDGVLIAYNGEGGEVVIPDGVTEIGGEVFRDNKTITSVVIPEGVTSIGYSAFMMASNLQSVSFPSTIETIEADAFGGCISLKELDLASMPNLKTLGDSAFLFCVSLTELVIPDIEGLTVGQWTFSALTKLEKLTINADLVLYDTFVELPALKTLEVNGRLDLDSNGFASGNDFIGLDSIETMIFNADQGNLGFLIIEEGPNGPSFRNSFGICAMPKLKEVIFYGDVESINGVSFSSCPELESVVFYGDVGYIGKNCFANSPKLTHYTLGEGNTKLIFDEETQVVYDVNKTKMYMPSSWQYEGTFIVPETVTELADFQFSHGEYYGEPDIYASIDSISYTLFVGSGMIEFREDKLIEGVVLHEGITAIPEGCFFDCVNLTEIDYNGAQITSFGNYALRASGIVDLVFPETVTEIGGAVWTDCENLLSVTLPSGITELDSDCYSFSGCTSIKEIIVPEFIEEIPYQIAYNCTSLERIEFLNTSYTYVDVLTFAGTSSLKEVIGLDNITYIGPYAFEESGIETYAVPATVQTIDYYAFNNCANLRQIIFPEGALTTIGDQAFENCVSLEVINIPACLVNLNFANVFTGCTGITEINVAEGHPVYASVDGVLFNAGLTEMLLYPKAKEDVDFTTPDTLTYVGSNVMEGVLYLKTITMPEVTTIDDLAFYGASVETVIAPKLEYVGYGAFADCYNLREMDLTKVTTLSSYAFQNTDFTEVVLSQNLSKVGVEVFLSNENLTRVVIPAGTCAFDFSSVFYKCPVSEVEISEENANFTLYEGGVYNADKTALYKYMGTSESIVLPEGLLKICHEAFIDNTYVKNVVFPSTLLVIGDKAFYGCTSLETLEFKGETAPLLQGYYEEGVRYPYANFVRHISEVESNPLSITVLCPDNATYNVPVWRMYFGL